MYLAHPQQQALRDDLAQAGAVFEFAVWQWPGGDAPGEQAHLQVLDALFAEVIEPQFCQQQSDSLRYYDKRITAADTAQQRRQLQAYRAQALAYNLSWDTAYACGRLLDNRYLYAPDTLKSYEQYQHMDEAEWLLTLYHNFNDPPYGLQITAAERLPLWQRFCEITGLVAEEQPQVYDWLRHQVYGDSGNAVMQHPLSNYFDAGLEWWGVWCLTVYNPRRRTLAAIAASATD
ncbi:hypothetical protein L1281_001035 [Neisseria sp. HSC-16F19]|nr:hypothetical protein [Neisseria sp. HSC-16F19]MCP2040452.1 hypothetical protein [Neisseria sp. HSC-16F19]